MSKKPSTTKKTKTSEKKFSSKTVTKSTVAKFSHTTQSATFDKTASILVIGAGAIGGISAAFMKLAGYHVEIVCKYPEYAAKIESEGLHVFGVRREHQVKMKAYATLTEIKGQYDVVFIATKVNDLAALKTPLLRLLKKDSAVVSLQNGIVVEQLAHMVGAERAIGAVVGWGATMHSHGELEMTSTGEFVIGSLPGYNHRGITFVQELLNRILPTDISNNIIGALYSKLIINSCITAMGALSGLYLGEMLAEKKFRKIFLAIMREAMAVAEAAGIKVETYANKINYYKLLKSNSRWGDFKRHTLIRLIGFKYRRLKSSSLQSLERGKPTEISELNGAICRLGKKFKVPTPVNDAIVAMVKEIEHGKRKVSPTNLEHPAFTNL